MNLANDPRDVVETCRLKTRLLFTLHKQQNGETVAQTATRKGVPPSLSPRRDTNTSGFNRNGRRPLFEREPVSPAVNLQITDYRVWRGDGKPLIYEATPWVPSKDVNPQ